MTLTLAFFLLVGPFFAVLAAWIWVVWPENPFDDEAYDRRHQAHFRQAHPTPLGESQPDFARRGDALCRDAVAAFRGSPDNLRASSGVASSTGPSTPVPGLAGMDAMPDVRERVTGTAGE